MTPTRTTVWVDNQVLTASALNGEFNNLLNAPAITDADIAANANITFSKINSANATLTKPTINGSVNALTTDAYASSITLDGSASNIHTITLGGNPTLSLSNISVGQAFVVRLIQGSGGQTVTWWGTIKWPGGVQPVLNTTAGKTDVFGFLTTSAGNYDGYIIGLNL